VASKVGSPLPTRLPVSTASLLMMPLIGDSTTVYLTLSSAWVTEALPDSTAASASWIAVR
jgi:hypothetical protein